MKKIYLLFTLLFCVILTNAQDNKSSLAKQLVSKNSEAIGLSQDQLNNYKLSSTYFNEMAGTQMVYLLQTYKGLPVYNQMLVLAFKNEKVVSNTGAFIQGMDKITNYQPASPSIVAMQAVKAAFTEVRLAAPSSLSVTSTRENGRVLDFGKTNAVSENITAELMWVPIEKGNQRTVKLAWQVQVVPAGFADWWDIQIDASTGAVINKYNQTVYEAKGQKADNFLSFSFPRENSNNVSQVSKRDLSKLKWFTPPPPTVTSADYRVVPFPIESPNYGSFAVVNNPWNLSGAGNNATTNGWHFDGTTNYDFTRGNNVFAYLDVSATNAPNAANNWPDTSTTANPSLTFTQTFDPVQQPAVNVNKKAAINNLFYWNNLMHDVFYQYGFNEVTGNYQTDNFGRGGNGGDYVQAEAQDGGGTNNANFNAGGGDGGRPRMQMYLWSPAVSSTLLHVNAPGTIVGNYGAVESNFSPNNLLANVGPKTGDVVYYDDPAGGTHYGCTNPPLTSLTGKIALIVRGPAAPGTPCAFTVKVLAAQAAGAIAVIMVNNVAGAPIIMGGGPDPSITIPAVMISNTDGAILAAQLGAGLNVTLSGTPAGTVNIDGDIDNGIVCHEFGHGISNRLTGGPATSACLGNAEEGGEGWSDYMGLMMTTNWATAQLTDGALVRPMGTYAFGQTATSAGIRNYPYCTNIAVNPLTYASLGVAPIGTEVHNIGEVWCMALWELTWRLIQDQGSINANLFNATGTGGNTVALKLVVEGMRTQPCSPGFIDARNAILTADQNLYGGAHLCSIWAAFAKRGMGYSALQGSSFSASDQTAATDLPPAPSFTAQPVNVTACSGNNAVFSTTATGYNLTYNWQVSTNAGVTWTNLSPAVTTATLTLTGVTGAMNNNQYHVVVSGGCPNTPVSSSAATLTVNTASPTITSQPANTSACAGTDASFSITVSGTNTYNWQVSTDGGLTWNNVSPAVTTTTLTLTAVTLGMNNYQYRCVVTGGCPSASFNSTPATLSVTTGAIAVTGDPSNASACAGGNASFTVTATGASLTYNWQVSTDGGITWTTLIPAVTTPTLTLTGVTAGMNNNQYHVVVNGPGACTPAGITSNAATLTISSAVAITSQPVSASVCTGNNATFTVATSGSNATYNWQVSTDGGLTWNDVVPAVTTATLTLTGVTAGMDNNQYHVVIGGTCNAVAITSNAATLTINTPASVTSQPSDATACAGSNASFSVTASGSGLSYNWQVSTDGGLTWSDLTPAVTTATLTLTGITAVMNNYKYRCVVSISCNPVGVNSNPATLTVNSAPSITAQPANTAVCAAGNAQFCVSAAGAGVTYQWQVSTTGCTGPWTNVTGGNAACLDLTGVSAGMNNNNYQCIVSGSCAPSVTSTCGTLTVNTAAAITAQPANSTGCTGGNATFSVTGSGTGLTYNWQVSTDGGLTWNNLSPAVTTPTLTLTGVTAGMNNNQYHVVVDGTCSAVSITSNAATLTLDNAVAFSTQPTSAGVCAGTDVTFTVAATGTGLAYNWQVSTNGGTSWANVSPVNNTNTLTIIAPTVAMSGYQYRNVASGNCNPAGLNSSVATLTVNTSVTLTSQPADIIGCTGSAAVFTVTATGSSITYQWQVSVGGAPFVDLTNSAPYSGVTTNTLTINPATGLNGNRYRLNASGAPCGGIITSNSALLDVKALPVVVLTAASYSNITPYIRETLYTTVSPPGNYTYQWFRNGVLVPSLTADRFAVTVDDLGVYEVIATDAATGCSSKKSNTAHVDFAASDELFIYPNPSSGVFQVRYLSYTSGVVRTLNIYDSKGARVYQKEYTTAGPYTKMDVNMNNAASDVYLVELRDANGKRLASGKVVIR
ncbi:MAG: M36 family metallopeptidase [Ferruginibacter sp.]